MSQSIITLAVRRFVRQLAGAWNNCPVEVVPGSAEPRVTGDGWHYRTRGGRRIWHPSAYSRSGWSNMVYVGSTYAVTVGADWLRRHLPAIA